ncbi:hypothetical protein VUR80DRAFT_3565 [Thermomyces stellatus]
MDQGASLIRSMVRQPPTDLKDTHVGGVRSTAPQALREDLALVHILNRGNLTAGIYYTIDFLAPSMLPTIPIFPSPYETFIPDPTRP